MRRVIVFVFLGAIINLAIAWGSALWTVAPWGTTWPMSLADPNVRYSHWALTETGSLGSVRIMAMDEAVGVSAPPKLQFPSAFSDLTPRLLQRSADAVANGNTSFDSDRYERVPPLMVEARGWPCLAWRCEWDFRRSAALNNGFSLPPAQSRNTRISSPFMYTVYPGDLRALPYVPIVPGFVVNTLFYALLAWLASSALARLLPSRIRARRLKRGVCPTCKYPIGASAVCTECGAPLNRSQVAGS